MLSKRVVVQVITFCTQGAEEELDALFDSLARVVAPEGGWSLTVIDNPSPHGTMHDYLESKIRPRAGMDLPEVRLIYSDDNGGFTGGHNLGWKAVEEDQPEFLYLLNNDAYVDPEILTTAVAYAETHQNDAIIQSRVMLAQDPTLLNTCGNCMHYLGFGYADGYKQTPEAVASHPRPHFYASGAAVLLRSSFLAEVGGLFAETFMYHEDVDISWRARLLQRGIGYAEDSVMFHRYAFSKSIKKFYWMERNRHLTNIINYRLPTLALLIAPMLMMEIGTFAFAVKSGWWKEKLRAWIYFFQPSVWPEILSRRAFVQTIRTATDRQMLEQMVGIIDAQEVENPLMTHLVNPVLASYFSLLKAVVRW